MKKILFLLFTFLTFSIFAADANNNVKIIGITSHEQGTSLSTKSLILTLSNGKCVYVPIEDKVTVSTVMFAFTQNKEVNINNHADIFFSF